MRSVQLAIVGMVVLGTVAPRAAVAQSLDLVFDTACTDCSIAAEPNVPFTLHIVLRDAARLVIPAGWGIAEVSFRIEGLPEDWRVRWAPNPIVASATDPFAPGGARVLFQPRLGDPPPCSSLYTCTITPTTTPAHRFEVWDSPARICGLPPDPQRPVVVVCPGSSGGEAKVCYVYCVQRGSASLDGTPCTTALVERPWSLVKTLYR